MIELWGYYLYLDIRKVEYRPSCRKVLTERNFNLYIEDYKLT